MISQMEFKMWKLKDRPSLTKQISRWFELQNEDSRAWSRGDFEVTGIQLILRNYTNGISEDCLTVSSIYLTEDLQNQNVFKSLLNYLVEMNPWEMLAIEDISNPILRDFCKKYGFKVVSPNYNTSYYISKNQLPKFEVPEFQY